jgi:DNA-binding transcriptional LysR family regulator
MRDLEALRVFVRVAERGSLTAVARELGMAQPTVSRLLKELEASLGTVLIQRTTRRLALTEAGASFYDKASTVLRLLDEAREDLRDARSRLRGTIRLSCTAALGIMHVSHLIFRFQDANPGVKIDLGLTDERVDLVREGVDIAVRFGSLADSSLVARRIGAAHRLLVAAPEYLSRHGRPQKPGDLRHHNLVGRIGDFSGNRLQLTGPDGAAETIDLAGNFRTDQGLAIREALRAGRGIGVAHRWLVEAELRAGLLVEVLAAQKLDPVPLYIVMVPGRTALLRVRRLVDHLARTLPEIPGFEPAASEQV